MIKLEHEPDNGIQPWIVYSVKGRKKEWRASFSTKKAAQDWIDCCGE